MAACASGGTRASRRSPPGVATLSPETLGYEWDEDLDNGARPAGLVHLSSTTVDGVEKIIDFGATIGIGTATHSLTLYRHASGALVFGAGTVQWSWGLDGTHDRGASLRRSGNAAGDREPAGRHGRAARHAADRRQSDDR